jgi:hypothetical protein
MRFGSGVPGAITTSLIALLGSPADWNGKSVSVIGFVHSEIHGVFLFSTSEHCERFMSGYAIGVVLDEMKPEVSWTALPRKDCLLATVSGVFVSTPVAPPNENAIVIGTELSGEIDALQIDFE